MIPILYPASEKEFKSNGIGRLADCVRFDVTEERNGIYECEFEYPMTGDHFKDIQDGCFVYATHDNSGKPQAFQVYKRSAPIKGIVTFNAWHISYALRDMVVAPFEATSCAQALQKIPANTIGDNPFTFWTDKSVTGDYKLKEPRAIRATLGGQQGSILDVYGKSDYEFDMYDVKLYVDRGSDRGVSIRYGKNMADLQQTLDASEIVNGVVPFWSSSDGDVVYCPYAVLGRAARTQELPIITHDLEPILTHEGREILARYADLRIGVLDLSSDFDEEPTPAQLEAKARAYMQGSDAYQLKENITVDFVQLWQTEEYKDYASLQRVFLCDTVHIYHERLGINATAKCIKVVYDTLKERYKVVELGEPKTTLNQQIADVSKAIIKSELDNIPDTAAMQKAIKYATEMITGGLGGYVVIAENEDGYPEEILIMDTPDKNTAINVWRFNQGGLGHSHNGYNGPFSDVALTADGRINANMITTGSLNAGIITTGTLSVDVIGSNSVGVDKLTGSISNSGWVINLQTGTLTIGTLTADKITAGILTDASGKNSWNLNTGQFITKQGKIGDFTIDAAGLIYSPSDPNRNESKIYPAQINLDRYSNGAFSKGIGITPENITMTVADGQMPTVYLNLAGYMHNGQPTATFTNYNASLIMSGANIEARGNFSVAAGHSKNKILQTDNYGERALYCYETPSPLYGDVGEGEIGADGVAYIWLDPIFAETIKTGQYQVQLQAYGQGECYVAERSGAYFKVVGTAGIPFGWELKAKQGDLGDKRLDAHGNEFTPPQSRYGDLAAEHLEEIQKGRVA